jgi:hypothetical protein
MIYLKEEAMKKGKWMRLGMGSCLLLSLLFLPGSDSTHTDWDSCALCFLEKAPITHGYLEIQNKSVFNIVVEVTNLKGYYGEYKLGGLVSTLPSSVSLYLYEGGYEVYVYVCAAISQKENFYIRYPLSVPGDLKKVVLPIALPSDYVPNEAGD